MSSRGKMPCSNQSPTSAQDVRPDELANRVANRALLVVEERVDREVVEGVDRRRPLGRRRHAPDILRAAPRLLTASRGGA